MSPRTVGAMVAAVASVALAAGLPMIVAAAQGGLAPDSSRTIRVAASIFPLAAIAGEIGGDRVAVTTLVPPGADPHNFELTPTTARAIEQAQAVFLVGGQFDRWILGSESSQGAQKAREFQGIFADSLIKTGDQINPHIWLDPLVARRMGSVIGLELARIDPSNRAYYEGRVAAFGATMDSLDASVKARLRKSGFKAYVAFHPAWTYFARRYGIEEAAILELTPEQEPSARWIAQVLKTIRQHDIRFIIAEEFSNKALADMVAKDSGARVIVLDPVGGADRPGRDSYSALINYNLALIEEATRRVR